MKHKRKIHLHSEQFDGYLHATCGAFDLDPREGENDIVDSDRFEGAAKCLRCRNCARDWWPRGGEPD